MKYLLKHLRLFLIGSIVVILLTGINLFVYNRITSLNKKLQTFEKQTQKSQDCSETSSDQILPKLVQIISLINSIIKDNYIPPEEIGYIKNKNDCPFTYTKSIDDRILEVDNLKFIGQSFPTNTNSFNNGSCIYMQKDGIYSRIYGNPSWRTPVPLVFLNNKYLLIGYGCGTECYVLALVDADTSEVTIIEISPYHEISYDKKWLIIYYRQNYLPENTDEYGLSRYENYLAVGINLKTFERYTFASNPYFKDFKVTDSAKFENYWTDVNFLFSNEKNLKYGINKAVNGILIVPYKDHQTGEIFERKFEINNNFKEIN